MILCEDTTTETGERAGAGAGIPPPSRKREEVREGRSGLLRVAYMKIKDVT